MDCLDRVCPDINEYLEVSLPTITEFKVYSMRILKTNKTIMAKGQDSKKNVKKEATKTPKEKKAEKKLKKAK